MGLRSMVSPSRGGEASHLYNLTLEEVQNQLGDLGKPLSSMNLDELLKSVIAVEENHLSPHSSTDASSSTMATPLLPGNHINLNRTVSRKTVDEIWSEIVQHQHQHQNHVDDDYDDGSAQFGEMTLEDFLVRAGAINHDIIAINSQAQAHHLMAHRPEWLPYPHQMPLLGSALPVAPPVLGNNSTDNQLPLTMQVPLVGGTTLSDSQASSAAAAERKRQYSDELMEKTIERRQKRMIKNRESAARSRARKQAYTNQLEQEVSNLRKTNWRLKKHKEMEMLLPLNQSSVQPKYQLRRTSTAPF